MDPVGRVRRSRHPATPRVPCLIIARRRCACTGLNASRTVPSPSGRGRGEGSTQCGCLCYRWLQRSLRCRLIACVMSLRRRARTGGKSPPPLYPRAPASNIAAARCLRLIPAGFGSGRGSVRAKHGPQPASMRAAPAFRERLSDVEAASTGSFSSPVTRGDLGGRRRSRHPAKSRIPCLISCPAALRLHGPTGCEPVSGSCRSGKRSATRQNNRAYADLTSSGALH